MDELKSKNQYKVLREKMGMTQKELAEALGIDTLTISAWECGRQKPSQALSRALLALIAQKV